MKLPITYKLENKDGKEYYKWKIGTGTSKLRENWTFDYDIEKKYDKNSNTDGWENTFSLYKKLKENFLIGRYDEYIYNFKYSYLYSHIKYKRFYSRFIRENPNYLKVYLEFVEDIRLGKVTESVTDKLEEKEIIKALKINILYAEVLRRFFKLKKNIRRKLW